MLRWPRLPGTSMLPNVVVDSAVGAAGVRTPQRHNRTRHTGRGCTFDTVLLRRATDKIKESTAAWANYAAEEGDGNVIKPLVVFQIPNKPDPDDIGRASTHLERWPEVDRRVSRTCVGGPYHPDFCKYTTCPTSHRSEFRNCWVRVLTCRCDRCTGWIAQGQRLWCRFAPCQRQNPHHPIDGANGSNPPCQTCTR